MKSRRIGMTGQGRAHCVRIVPVCFALIISFPCAAQEKASPKTSASRIRISRETTYLTGPLDKEGRVDYLAALNERASKGVTRENNAAIPLMHALGASVIDAKVRDRFFEMLGERPADRGALVDEGDFCKEAGIRRRWQTRLPIATGYSCCFLGDELPHMCRTARHAPR